jgi:hypothetical protein
MVYIYIHIYTHTHTHTYIYIHIWCCSGCLENTFLSLLYGAGRFICLLVVYAQFVDGSPSIISAALLEYKEHSQAFTNGPFCPLVRLSWQQSFLRWADFSIHSVLTSSITPYRTSSTSHYDHRSLERWPFVARRNTFRRNFHKMSERHFEEWKLNGFKQDLCYTQEERGERTNKKTTSLTARETGPRVTQLSFFFSINGWKRSNHRLDPLLNL